MFVLMVAALPLLISAQPPEVPQRAGLGDRFHYFRGASGRRYLFSTVPRCELADFHSAVVIFAHPTRSGRLAADRITVLDGFGRPSGHDGRWPPTATLGAVHLLSASDSERHQIVADLSAASLPADNFAALAA